MKARAKAGFSLIEMLVTLLIMVLLVIGIGVGMNSGASAYKTSIFEANSSMLADIVNTNLGDMLRYSQDIRVDGTKGVMFTNLDYGIKDGYFYQVGAGRKGVLRIYDSERGSTVELVNSGSYPELEISDFVIEYEDGYFEITYNVQSKNNPSLSREFTTVVRPIQNG